MSHWQWLRIIPYVFSLIFSFNWFCILHVSHQKYSTLHLESAFYCSTDCTFKFRIINEVDYRCEDDCIQTDTGHSATYTFHATGRHQVQPLLILPIGKYCDINKEFTHNSATQLDFENTSVLGLHAIIQWRYEDRQGLFYTADCVISDPVATSIQFHVLSIFPPHSCLENMSPLGTTSFAVHPPVHLVGKVMSW